LTTVVENPPQLRRHHPDLALAVIVSCQLMIGIDTTVVTVALPHIQAGLHFSTANLSWVQNIYMLTFGGLLLLGGRAGDLFGRRRTLIAGVSLFTVASLLGGLATDGWMLLAARGLQGVGAAVVGPSAMALIATLFEGPARVRALSIFSAVTGAGGATGLLLGGVLTEAASWRWVMFINVPIGLLIIAAAPVFLTETARRTVRFDFAGAFLSTAGSSSLVFAFIQAADHGWGDGTSMGAFVAALVLLTGFVLAQRRAAEPVMPLSLFADRTRASAYFSMLLLPGAMFGMFFFATQYLQNVLDYSPLQAGFAFLPMMACQFACVRLLPRFLPRFGVWPFLVTGMALVTVGMFWLAALSATDGYAAGLLGPLALMGLGGGMSMLPLNVTVLSSVRPEEAGAASGVAQSAIWSGGALGSAVLVSVYGSATRGRPGLDALVNGMNEAFLVGALAFAIPALLVAVFLLRPRAAQGA
jgi:EmrB/QacA subfamily drug resistance transporter